MSKSASASSSEEGDQLNSLDFEPLVFLMSDVEESSYRSKESVANQLSCI